MSPRYVRIAVEGKADTGIAQKLLDHEDLRITGQIIIRHGTGNLDKLIAACSKTAKASSPWVVLRDCDSACPVELRERLLGPSPANPHFVLRLATSMSEAWLLADHEGFSRYFSVQIGRLPDAPDVEPHAKRSLLHLVESSRNKRMQSDVVGQHGRPGKLYVDRINEFAQKYWDIDRAAGRSPSLNSALIRLSELRERLPKP